jgi:hypothetical protein
VVILNNWKFQNCHTIFKSLQVNSSALAKFLYLKKHSRDVSLLLAKKKYNNKIFVIQKAIFDIKRIAIFCFFSFYTHFQSKENFMIYASGKFSITRGKRD